MTDAPPPDSTLDPEIEDRPRRGLSAVWLVPVVAVVIALAIVWQSYRDRGELIAITFPDASGVTVGETTLRFREVIVGVVEDVGFSSDLASVNVYVRVNREISPYLDEDASFWIVQPSVTTRGVEGLGTILSGTYIQGTWDDEVGDTATVFIGNTRAPIVPPGVDGTAIVLRASDSARLAAGAPILYRGIQVGEVASPRLSQDGTEVRIDAFVRAPYDQQITTATRFWDASGVTATLGGSGFELNVGSLAAILEGGIVFDTLISGGERVEPGHIFEVFADRDNALASTFEAPSAQAVRFSALFPTAASGLTEGAPVRFQGVRVGVITAITGFVRPDDPAQEVQLLAVMAIQPGRMGLDDAASTDLDAVDYVDTLVRRGLRAQLVSTSLLGGSLAVDLIDVENATTPIGLEVGIVDNPLIPTIEGDTASITATAEGVLTRINDLPVEELLAAATDLLESVNRVASDPATRAVPSAVLELLDEGGGLARDARSIVASPQTASVLNDVQTITSDLRGVTARITERQLADRIADLTEAATGAAENIETATEPVAEFVRTATVVFDEAGRLISSERIQELPGLLTDAVAAGRTVLTSPAIADTLDGVAGITQDVRALTTRLDGEGLSARIDAVLGSVDTAARNVAEGTAGLDTLRSALDGAANAARDLLSAPETQALPTTASELLGGADALVGDLRTLAAAPEIQALLADLPQITSDIRALMQTLVEGQAAVALTAALQAAEQAADSVARGAEGLPALSTSAQSVAAEAEVLASNLNVLVDRANALALDDLVNATTDLMVSADAFISSDEADDVPVALVDTLQEVRRTIATIRDGGTLDNLNATLSSASGAADSIRTAATSLPELVNRLQTLTGSATSVLSTYDSDSRVAQELFATLRAATRAAEDVSSLSRTIERNPNSLLLGR